MTDGSYTKRYVIKNKMLLFSNDKITFCLKIDLSSSEFNTYFNKNNEKATKSGRFFYIISDIFSFNNSKAFALWLILFLISGISASVLSYLLI